MQENIATSEKIQQVLVLGKKAREVERNAEYNTWKTYLPTTVPIA
jgi:hypothetical protein